MAVATINDIECYYEVHGKGRPLVLIGGVSSDSQTWRPVSDLLKKSFEVILFDNRASGRTYAPAGSFDISVLANDTVSLLDHLKIEKADILGHSMGGYVAQEIAIHYPVKVDRLILESTASCTSERNKGLFHNMVRMREENIPYGTFLREFMFWLFSPEYFDDKKKVDKSIEYLERYPYKQDLDGFRDQIRAYSEYSSLDDLHNIKAETLIMRGENDLIISEEDIRPLVEKISNAAVVKVKASAHALHMEEPDIFAGEVETFIKHS